KKYKKIDELPFDPIDRRRRVVLNFKNKNYLVVIGAAETLLKISKSNTIASYEKVIKTNGSNGLRHIAIAYSEVKFSNSNSFEIIKHEKNLKFVGFVSLENPLRASSKRTIELAEQLGVNIKIFSGDSPEVTGYVARQVGLLKANQSVLVGEDIDILSNYELSEVVANNNAFARLNPKQKYRIIDQLKAQGNVVGYQGDGINDAPALKLADVAIAVNSAADVAKESADILLLRQDLEVIVNGIKYGREIF
ncbi:MAG TPA: HAD-IC family P-type ATPase, partial [Patescibacteria group bacterium]|nr:HAD-IC family P-type ATPase [Patescibacteria group bacterium]